MTPVSRFGGERVVNTEGQALGVLHDVVIDGEHSRIAYAIVSAGGFMGVGERLYVVPWTAVSANGDASYLIEADEALLAAAPELEGGRWPDDVDQAWHERVHRHFGVAPYWH
jgi:sporulation protein YlmC with PRC-barrel domain